MRFDAPAADAARVVVVDRGRPVAGMAVAPRQKGGTIVPTDATERPRCRVFPRREAAVVVLCDPRVADDFCRDEQPPLAAGETASCRSTPCRRDPRPRVSPNGSRAAGSLVRPTRTSRARPKAPVATSPEGWAVKFGDGRFADEDGAALLVGLPPGATCEVSTFDGVAGLKASTSVVPGTADSPAEVTLTLK
jgi:hypothetical protein